MQPILIPIITKTIVKDKRLPNEVIAKNQYNSIARIEDLNYLWCREGRRPGEIGVSGPLRSI